MEQTQLTVHKGTLTLLSWRRREDGKVRRGRGKGKEEGEERKMEGKRGEWGGSKRGI